MTNKKQCSILCSRAKIMISLEIIIIIALSVVVFMISARYEFLERLVEFAYRYEDWELDEFIVVAIFLLFVLIFVLLRQWRRVHTSEKKLLQSNKELEKALSEIKQLRGIIPICASCKKVRDDSGFWQQVEVYIREHTDAKFSHGICPECAEKIYPEFFHQGRDKIKKHKKQEEQA